MSRPTIKLLDINSDMLGMMSKVWQTAKGREPLDAMPALKPEEFERILMTDLPTQEYVWTIWYIDNMPRAFWDQFDRTRHAAFWEQSVRILDLKTFYQEGNFWLPKTFKTERAMKAYLVAMEVAEEAYQIMVEDGTPSEDARGVLPLHINVRGTCAINLRALKGVIQNRACFIAQGSYWMPVIKGMLQELSKHLPAKVIQSLTNLPCQGKAACPIEGNVVQRLTGEDPNPVCPIYLTRFASNRKEAEEFTKSKHSNYESVKKEYLDFIRSLGKIEGGEVSDEGK